MLGKQTYFCVSNIEVCHTEFFIIGLNCIYKGNRVKKSTKFPFTKDSMPATPIPRVTHSNHRLTELLELPTVELTRYKLTFEKKSVIGSFTFMVF